MTTANESIEFLVLNPDELPADAREFDKKFQSTVIGQEQARSVALTAYERAHNPLRDPHKPIGCFVLIGPSRTGKTLTAKACAKLFHGDEEALTILEAGDYMEKHQMLDLTGATPTYVGYTNPRDVKALDKDAVDPTSKISAHNLRRKRLNSSSQVDILCINEFEKGCPEFFRFWMGALDNGFIAHGNGMVTDLRNAIIYMTMNLGMEEVEKMQKGGYGFTTKVPTVTSQDVEDVVKEELQKRWPPEFRNRFNQVVIFRPHTRDEILLICERELSIVQSRINTSLKKMPFTLEVTPEAKDWLVAEAFKNNGNVAQLKRVIDKEISDKVGRELHKGTMEGARKLFIERSEDGKKLVFKAGRIKVRVPAATATPGETFEYRVQQGKLAVREGKATVRLYRVWLMTNSIAEANSFKGRMEKDLAEVFGLKEITEFYHKVEPFTVSKTVETSLAMSQLLKEHVQKIFPKAQVNEED
jgi:ATP-dependent Clp protease ATP-binding subunit ClpC